LTTRTVRGFLRSGYVEIVSRRSISAIFGAFPPFAKYFRVGHPENFFIHDGYRHRKSNSFYDDTGNKDDWQREVYEFARKAFDRQKLRLVCDLGCGSGYKLVRYFGDVPTIGIDLPPTCVYLREKYPDREWVEADFTKIPPQDIDMVIAADVLEHVPNPDEVLSYILKLRPQKVIISTPDRNLFGREAHGGPPINPAHVREWSSSEFHAYISGFFEIEKHFISNVVQCTQCVLCRPLRAG
jgi:SAM-dependent methyltransferase